MDRAKDSTVDRRSPLTSSSREATAMRYPPSASREIETERRARYPSSEERTPHRNTNSGQVGRRPRARSISLSSLPSPSREVLGPSVGSHHNDNEDTTGPPGGGPEIKNIPKNLHPSKEAPGSPDGFVVVSSSDSSNASSLLRERNSTKKISYADALVTQNSPLSRRSNETEVQAASRDVTQLHGPHPINVSEIQSAHQENQINDNNLHGTKSKESHDNKHGSSRTGRSITDTVRSYLSIGPGNATSSKDNALKEEIAQLEAELVARDEEYKELNSKYIRLKKKLSLSKRDNRRLEADLQSMQHQLQRSEEALQDSKTLAETRGRELVGAQVFLTKADSVSVSEIIDKVEVINQEIFQIAASLGEFLNFRTYNFKDEAEFNHSIKLASRIFGEEFVRILVKMAHASDPEVNPLFVQATISILLVKFTVHYLLAWRFDDNISTFLELTYTRIRCTEEQAVSGRWRAITRAQERTSSDVWKQDLMKNLYVILKVSFWFLPSEHQSGFEQKLLPFFKAIDDLKISLGEKFTSADLEAYEISAGKEYDAHYMEDAFGDARRNRSQQDHSDTVAGTAGIGLQNIIYIRGPDGHFEKKPSENVLSPKVILLSTLHEALEPPPPRHKKRRD